MSKGFFSRLFSNDKPTPEKVTEADTAPKKVTLYKGDHKIVEKSEEHKFEVKPDYYYHLKGGVKAIDKADPKGALLAVKFYDENGDELNIEEKRPPLAYSSNYGLYSYIKLAKKAERFQAYFKTPEEAKFVGLVFHTFRKVKSYQLKNVSISVILNKEIVPNNYFNSRSIETLRIKTETPELFVDSIREKIVNSSNEEEKFNWAIAAFNLLRKEDHYHSREFGSIAYELRPDFTPILRDLATSYRGTGDVYKALELRKRHCKIIGEETNHSVRQIECEANLLENGFPISERSSDTYQHNKKVLYMLHNSLPYNSGGYATRSHGLLKGIKHHGYDVAACSRFGYPNELVKQGKTLPEEIPLEENIEGIDYHRLLEGSLSYGDIVYSEYMQKYIERLAELGRKLDINVYHGASNSINGLAAIQAARINGKKSVYEVRGLWEITRLSRDPRFEGSDQYKLMCDLEAQACLEADGVICITKALRKIMVERGVPEEKITIVSNATHTDIFEPLERDNALGEELGIAPDEAVIGYVGSVVNYEGLDLLMEAVAELKKRGLQKFKCLIVGDGAVWEDIKQTATDLDINDKVIFTGRVPHDAVNAYYSLVDIAPFPRKPYLVCEAVSPIKPFEAMAMEKAVIGSSCAAIMEIIDHENTGLIFEKGNSTDLADKIELYINNPDLRQKLAQNGRKWIVEEKDWKHVAKNITGIYDSFE